MPASSHYPLFYNRFILRLKDIADLVQKKQYPEALEQTVDLRDWHLEFRGREPFQHYQVIFNKLEITNTLNQLYNEITDLEKQKCPREQIDSILDKLNMSAHLLNFLENNFNDGSEVNKYQQLISLGFFKTNRPIYNTCDACHGNTVVLTGKFISNQHIPYPFEQVIKLFLAFNKDELQLFAKMFSSLEITDVNVYQTLDIRKNNIFDEKYKLVQFAINLTNQYKENYGIFLSQIAQQHKEFKVNGL